MRAFNAVRFPFGLFLARSPDCNAVHARAASPSAATAARPSFLIVLLRALSAWGV
jgi:hypothetical protein